MRVLPIPRGLLREKIKLLVPADSGYSVQEICSVRVVRTSKVREYNSTVVRDSSEILVYYDCTNSVPAGISFSAGMLILFDDRRYEIISAEEFSGNGPHHIRITARTV